MLSQALSLNLQRASMINLAGPRVAAMLRLTCHQTGYQVEATVDTLTNVLLELGDNFDSHYTADLTDARGKQAWPICGCATHCLAEQEANFVFASVVYRYTYLILHQNSTSSCDMRKAVVLFWQWFYTATISRNIITSLSFAFLPESVRDRVVTRLLDTTFCVSALVPSDQPRVLTLTGSPLMSQVYSLQMMVRFLQALLCSVETRGA